MSEIFVTKRDGTLDLYDAGKIKSVINWSCKGLEVSPLKLESKIEDIISNKVSTQDIHDNIIHHANTLASPEEPDWVFVAGRLNTMKLWKETEAYGQSFPVYVDNLKQKGSYTHPALNTYTQKDMKYLGEYIDPNTDLQHSYGSTLTANKKYLLEGESIQNMFMVNAMIIFSKIDKSIRNSKVIELYKALSERKVSLATPWLANLRSNGNISSCFIISVADNLESISDCWKKAASISKMGGGLGIYLGNLRAKGSSINGRPNSSKSINVGAKIFNDIAQYIDQGGKRSGAFTLALPIWHNDIDEFLEIQHESGDVRNKAYDIFPQITTPDLFWKYNKEAKVFYTFCPKECLDNGIDLNSCFNGEWEKLYEKAVELYKTGVIKNVTEHNSRELVKKLMRNEFETGLPYITFIDKINRENPNKHVGNIYCTNLCVESYSVMNTSDYSHTCNLASVVAGRMESLEDFSKYAALLTEVLDYGIELTAPPTKCSKKHNNSFRTIGVGIQGYHDWLARNYKSYMDKKEASLVAEYIQYGAVEKSIELARDKGAYPMFKGSEWENGNQITKFSERSNSELDWKALQEGIDRYGIRNSQLTSPAPNTSTSVFMDASAGVMPVYAGFFREDNDNGKYPISSMFIKENPLSYEQSFRTYNQAKLAETVGAMQGHVDTGISAEYLFDQNKPDFSAKTLYDMLISAWESETKAVYYVRSIKKGKTVDDLLGIKEESCSGCSG